MLRKLTVRNMKCLRDVTLDLAPLTILVGPNDSGKTSLLEAIHLLSETTRRNTHELFTGSRALASACSERRRRELPAFVTSRLL